LFFFFHENSFQICFKIQALLTGNIETPANPPHELFTDDNLSHKLSNNDAHSSRSKG